MEMGDAIKELYLRREKMKQMGGEKRVRQQHERGRLTARERIDKLLDPDSFWEVGILNSSLVPEKADLPAEKICGIGTIDGRKVAVEADDRTANPGGGGKPGGLSRLHPGRKEASLRRIASMGGYPLVLLNDSPTGLRLPEGMGSLGLAASLITGGGPDKALFPLPRQNLQVVAIMGECFGGPSWQAAWSDFVVMVKGTAMGAAGPRIIGEAIGQRITPQQLCGWEIHANFTGQVDAFAENDEECLQIIRRFLSYMPSHPGEEPPYLPTQDDPYRRLEKVERIVSAQLNRGYDMHRLIRVIVDDGQYFPLKAEWAKAMITCLTRIGGRVVGIIANNPFFLAGAPDVPAMEKAVSFLRLCDSFNVPIIYIADIPGNYPGLESEKQKLPTKIVVLLEAQSLVTVPKIHILIRKAYGIGWRCMGADTADIAAAWPIASISFVDPATGVELVHGRRLAEMEGGEAERKQMVEEWSIDCTPWEGAALTALEIIDPKDTRKFIAESLDRLIGNKGSIGEHKLAIWPTGF